MATLSPPPGTRSRLPHAQRCLKRPALPRDECATGCSTRSNPCALRIMTVPSAYSWGGSRRAGLGSALLLVFERELQLGAVGERPTLIQGDVHLDDLSHPQIAEGP